MDSRAELLDLRRGPEAAQKIAAPTDAHEPAHRLASLQRALIPQTRALA